jgi:hypothetical protein
MGSSGATAEAESLQLTEEERVTLLGHLGSYLPDEEIGDVSDQERRLLDWYRSVHDTLEETNVLAVDKPLLD